MTPRPTLVLLAALPSWACRPAITDPGTSVGNPTMTMLRLAPAGGLEYQVAEAGVAGVGLGGCDGGSDEVITDQVVDLLDWGVEIPPGHWCEMVLVFDGPLHIEAHGDEGGSAFLILDPGEVWVGNPQGFEANDGQFVWELGHPDWISAHDLGVELGVDVEIPLESEDAEHLGDQLVLGATLYYDVDEDGEVSEEEREEHLLAANDHDVFWQDEPDAQDTDPDTEPSASCATSASNRTSTMVGWLAIIAMLSGFRRRTD